MASHAYWTFLLLVTCFLVQQECLEPQPRELRHHTEPAILQKLERLDLKINRANLNGKIIGRFKKSISEEEEISARLPVMEILKYYYKMFEENLKNEEPSSEGLQSLSHQSLSKMLKKNSARSSMQDFSNNLKNLMRVVDSITSNGDSSNGNFSNVPPFFDFRRRKFPSFNFEDSKESFAPKNSDLFETKDKNDIFFKALTKALKINSGESQKRNFYEASPPKNAESNFDLFMKSSNDNLKTEFLNFVITKTLESVNQNGIDSNYRNLMEKKADTMNQRNFLDQNDQSIASFFKTFLNDYGRLNYLNDGANFNQADKNRIGQRDIITLLSQLSNFNSKKELEESSKRTNDTLKNLNSKDDKLSLVSTEKSDIDDKSRMSEGKIGKDHKMFAEHKDDKNAITKKLNFKDDNSGNHQQKNDTYSELTHLNEEQENWNSSSFDGEKEKSSSHSLNSDSGIQYKKKPFHVFPQKSNYHDSHRYSNLHKESYDRENVLKKSGYDKHSGVENIINSNSMNQYGWPEISNKEEILSKTYPDYANLQGSDRQDETFQNELLYKNVESRKSMDDLPDSEPIEKKDYQHFNKMIVLNIIFICVVAIPLLMITALIMYKWAYKTPYKEIYGSEEDEKSFLDVTSSELSLNSNAKRLNKDFYMGKPKYLGYSDGSNLSLPLHLGDVSKTVAKEIKGGFGQSFDKITPGATKSSAPPPAPPPPAHFPMMV